MSAYLIYDPGGSGTFTSEVEPSGLPGLTNRQANDNEFSPFTPTTHLITKFQQLMLAYLMSNLAILAITLLIAIIRPNSNSNPISNPAQQFNPTNTRTILGNGYLNLFSNSNFNFIFFISNKLRRVTQNVALIFGINLCLYGKSGVSPYIRTLKFIGSVRCCQLRGGCVFDAGIDKCGMRIGFITMIGIHFFLKDLIFNIFFNSISRLLMVSPVCGFSKWYQCVFLSARICIYCKFRSLMFSLFSIGTEFVFEFLLCCFILIRDFYFFLPIVWNIFYFFVNNIQCELIEPITWFWFRVWNVIRGDR